MEIRVPPEAVGERLDVVRAEHVGSRTAAVRLIDAGLVTVDGEARALWKARKQGRRLEITLEGDADRDAVLEQAERLAPHRGATSVVLG